MRPALTLAAAVTMVCCATVPSMARAADPFTVQFAATSTDNKPLTATVEVNLYDDSVASDTLADGTKHRRFTGYSMGMPWSVQTGTDAIYAAQQPGSPFQVDVFLKADNSSSLVLATSEGPGGGSTYYEYSNFKLELACQCANLFTDSLTAQTFAKYSTLNGRAESYQEWFPAMPGDPGKVVHQTLSFSSAVPEPSSVALVMAGLAVGMVSRRKAFRR